MGLRLGVSRRALGARAHALAQQGAVRGEPACVNKDTRHVWPVHASRKTALVPGHAGVCPPCGVTPHSHSKWASPALQRSREGAFPRPVSDCEPARRPPQKKARSELGHRGRAPLRGAPCPRRGDGYPAAAAGLSASCFTLDLQKIQRGWADKTGLCRAYERPIGRRCALLLQLCAILLPLRPSATNVAAASWEGCGAAGPGGALGGVGVAGTPVARPPQLWPRPVKILRGGAESARKHKGKKDSSSMSASKRGVKKRRSRESAGRALPTASSGSPTEKPARSRIDTSRRSVGQMGAADAAHRNSHEGPEELLGERPCAAALLPQHAR